MLKPSGQLRAGLFHPKKQHKRAQQGILQNLLTGVIAAFVPRPWLTHGTSIWGSAKDRHPQALIFSEACTMVTQHLGNDARAMPHTAPKSRSTDNVWS